MPHSIKQCTSLLFLVIMFFSCQPIEEQVENEVEIYVVMYEIDFINNTDEDIMLSIGFFSFPSDNPLGNVHLQTTLKKNNEGSFLCDWAYTHYFFVREPFMDPGDYIRSFYLQLEMGSKEYFLAGWPEDVYHLDNTISYGHGWGYDASSIGLIQEGELMRFVFDDAPGFTNQRISARAQLCINSAEDIVFKLTEFPQTLIE